MKLAIEILKREIVQRELAQRYDHLRKQEVQTELNSLNKALDALISFDTNQDRETDQLSDGLVLDDETKVIAILSGYVRELSEGNDYLETTYKTAAGIVKVCNKSDKK